MKMCKSRIPALYILSASQTRFQIQLLKETDFYWQMEYIRNVSNKCELVS